MVEGARDSEGMVRMLCVQVGRITVFSSGVRPVRPGVKEERTGSRPGYPGPLCQPPSDLGAFPILSTSRQISRVSAPGCG